MNELLAVNELLHLSDTHYKMSGLIRPTSH